MGFTTVNIAQLVDPGDGSILQAVLYKPDPVAFPGPRPVWCGTHSPGMKYSDLASLGRVFAGEPGSPESGLVNNGIICVAFNVRGCLTLGPGAPGQTSSGAWHDQTDDFHAAVAMFRQGGILETTYGLEVTGMVGGVGGSGSAHHAAYCCIDGTQGVDKLDCAISLSAPLDFGDRAGDSSEPHFIDVIEKYCESTDIVVQRQKGPTGLNLALANNLHITNGDNENQPTHQAQNFNALMRALPGGPPANYFFQILTDATTGTGSGEAHAFAEWPFVFAFTIPYILARIAEFNGGSAPPPPQPTGRERVTAAITGLPPGAPLTLNVQAIDRRIPDNPGPLVSFDFISDRADTGAQGKDAPVGVYALVDATDGVINGGNIADRDWLGFAYVDGGILPTTWGALNPTSRSSFNWTAPDAFLAACAANSKFAGMAISMGIKDPPWIYGGSHAVSGFAVNGPNSGTIPIPWDANYLQVVKGFIKEFATRYDAHTSLSYVVVGGMGQLLDTLLVQAGADYTNMNNNAVIAGYPDLITAWTQTSVAILDVWAKAMRATTVILALELPVPSVNGGLTGIDEFTRNAITHYRSRFGPMTLELDGLTSAGPDLSLNSIIRDATQNPKGFRFFRPSSDPACDPSQDPGSYVAELGLRNAANAGIALGAQFEEFYEADILTVSGSYPADFADFQTDLTANAV